jgi:hypothetical protein
MADSKKDNAKEKPRKRVLKFNLLDDIKASKYYGKRAERSAKARAEINENIKTSSKSRVVPGQLVMFNYFNPKTEEDLEYYDAMPCTIFFGLVNTQQGRRYLGFNIHYYPPKLRYRVMHKIFEIYKPVYLKYFEDGLTKEIDAFDYEYLVSNLKKAKMDFGVRMYVPQLCGKPQVVPPKMWSTAVFTEGVFKKETRAKIMSYWKNKNLNAI